jgi:hypothetical protein
MRTRSITLVACAQVLLLSACAMTAPGRSPAPVTTTTPGVSTPTSAYRTGLGVIESASVVSLPSTASGGGSAGASGPTMAYAVKMPDGSTQNVVQAGERFQLGDRVQVTSDGRLVRP